MKRREFLLLLGGLALARPSLGQELIDLNSASQDEIESLPGIGEKMAEEIIGHRPYAKAEDLLQIPRFGKKRLEQIRDLVSFGPAVEGGAPVEGADAEAPAASPGSWKTPSGMETVQCWRCLELFAVEAGTEAGMCPYCSVRWGRKKATP